MELLGKGRGRGIGRQAEELKGLRLENDQMKMEMGRMKLEIEDLGARVRNMEEYDKGARSQENRQKDKEGISKRKESRKYQQESQQEEGTECREKRIIAMGWRWGTKREEIRQKIRTEYGMECEVMYVIKTGDALIIEFRTEAERQDILWREKRFGNFRRAGAAIREDLAREERRKRALQRREEMENEIRQQK